MYENEFLIPLGIYLELKFFGHMLALLNFLSNCQDIFPGGCTVTYFHW